MSVAQCDKPLPLLVAYVSYLFCCCCGVFSHESAHSLHDNSRGLQALFLTKLKRNCLADSELLNL